MASTTEPTVPYLPFYYARAGRSPQVRNERVSQKWVCFVTCGTETTVHPFLLLGARGALPAKKVGDGIPLSLFYIRIVVRIVPTGLGFTVVGGAEDGRTFTWIIGNMIWTLLDDYPYSTLLQFF